MQKIDPSDFQDFLQGPMLALFKNWDNDSPLPPVEVLYLSIHDHWLSQAEFVSQPILYREFIKRGQREKYFSFEQKMINWLAELLKITPILRLLDYDNSSYGKLSDCRYFRFENNRELQILTKRALREKGHEILIFPKHQAVLASGFDLTWNIWLFKPIPGEFKQLLLESGIPILKPRY